MIYDIEPCAAPRMTRRDKWARRPAVLRYFAFRDEVRLKNVQIWNGCTVVFHMPMPASWSRKKRDDMLGDYHTQKPDCDNLLKAIMDAVFDDDSHIAAIYIIKLWADKGAIEVF